MLDISNLERRWLKYKIKQFIPYGLSLVMAILLISGTYFWLSSHTAVEPELKKEDFNKSIASAPAKSTPEETQISSHQESMTLEPSMNFIQTMDTVEIPTVSAPIAVKPIEQAAVKSAVVSAPPPINKVLQLPTSEGITPSVKSSEKIVHDSQSLTINRNESKVDIGELQKRFKETSNASLGLFIARYSYDRGDYTEAYNYALKTNAINSHLDESWLIFAKSLVKIGKTEQAKKTLQLYISDSNSESARSLLDSIERGTFK